MSEFGETYEERAQLAENEVARLRAALAACQKDAERYRWLRQQNWHDSNLCVVANPQAAVKLGQICPSMDLLDAAIDAALKEGA